MTSSNLSFTANYQLTIFKYGYNLTGNLQIFKNTKAHTNITKLVS